MESSEVVLFRAATETRTEVRSVGLDYARPHPGQERDDTYNNG